jgi:oligopeptide/dipeptide ABC transporter ATP-binding protein
MALIMISHDLGLAAGFADEVLVMYAGRAVEHAPTRTLFAQVRMPYTQALLAAIPQLENPSHARLAAVPGHPPDLAAGRVGCPFEPRCPRSTERCGAQTPALEVGEPGHAWACWHPIGVEETVEVAT